MQSSGSTPAAHNGRRKVGVDRGVCACVSAGDWTSAGAFVLAERGWQGHSEACRWRGRFISITPKLTGITFPATRVLIYGSFSGTGRDGPPLARRLSRSVWCWFPSPGEPLSHHLVLDFLSRMASA